MAKGYNRKNKCRLIIRVQEEYTKHANSGMTTEYIYREYIYPRFLISRATFYNYLATPAKRELSKLEQADQQQGELF